MLYFIIFINNIKNKLNKNNLLSIYIKSKKIKDFSMKRKAFSMVELIFVIIIIGILAATAIPKFGDIKDRAKVNSEYSALSGLESALTAKIEFNMEDKNNIAIDWHNTSFGSSSEATYQKANTDKSVFGAISKQGDSLRIAAFIDLNKDGNVSDSNVTYDVYMIEGVASNHITGVEKATDVHGRPDKNDVWIFNGSPLNITVESGASATQKILHPGDLKLIDIEGVNNIQYQRTQPSADNQLAVKDSNGNYLTITLVN
jgi:prepilin-type N-terminal cleavage/methylation domain-containing protein